MKAKHWMVTGQLDIDLGAIARNWKRLDELSGDEVETSAVVKADAYGLGAGKVAPVLWAAGARSFFVATPAEGAALRGILGEEARIFIFCGYLRAARDLYRDHALIPILCSTAQISALIDDLPKQPCGLQVDTGMNRLGLPQTSLLAAGLQISRLDLRLVISHLACGDEAWHPMNEAQLSQFHSMCRSLPGVQQSLANTAGVLLGPAYHFAVTRPGIGLFGGLPFKDAEPVVSLKLPILQVRDILPGETVGYGAAFTARRASRIATVPAGYADGLMRALGNTAYFFAGHVPCPLAGRVSMDLISVDITELDEVPEHLDVIGKHQKIDGLAAAAGTVGYEILTSLGTRYERRYTGAAAASGDGE